MTHFAAIAAFAICRLVAAQSSTIDAQPTAIEFNPTDIASLPTPEALGPPIGDVQEVETVEYDAASVTASVISQALTATSIATDVSLTTDTAEATASVEASASVAKRYVAEKRSVIAIHGRSLDYPIDTTNTGAPRGYTPAFESLQGATQATGYLTYKTLKSYNATACAAACDKISTCRFFNIYYERDPDSNSNPVDVIKCSLYGIPQTSKTATNVGQWRGSFHVVITGSNGYNKAAALETPAGYTLESYDGAVNAPLRDSAGQWRFINPVYLPEYSPKLCAAACDAKTVFDYQNFNDGCNFHACVYANLYILSEDGAPKTVVCALYTEAVNETYAVNYGYTTQNPYHYYQVSNSIGITNTTAAALYPKDARTCSVPKKFYLRIPTDAGTAYDGTYITPLNNTGYEQFTVQTGKSGAAKFSLDTSGYLNYNQQQLFQPALSGIQLIEAAAADTFLGSMSQLVCKGSFVDISCTVKDVKKVIQVCKLGGNPFLVVSGAGDTYDGCVAIGASLTVVVA